MTCLLKSTSSRGLSGVGELLVNFWHSGTLAPSPECQSARMSKIKNSDRLDQYGAEPFEQQQFVTAGVEWG